MKFIQQIFSFCLLLAMPLSLFATHNRAGEITYRHITGYTYEFTVRTYTYKPSQANRIELDVSWGDGTTETVHRIDTMSLPNNYLFNTYIAYHTYPGAGIYEIYMEDPNRNLGVKNIPNSVNTIFSIKTTMLIGPFTGSNSTPILLNPPIDKAARGHVFIHNPGAYDPDGDSISYELTFCTAENGNPISGYIYPPATDTLYIDGIKGDLTWSTPVDTGVYNIALYIDEWRKGVRIGRITRDMQIDVYETDNNPPVNSIDEYLCVEAGDTLVMDFTSTDIDKDFIKIAMVGGPLLTNQAEYEVLESRAGFTRGRFTWRTNCSDAQNQPITLVLKSQDIVSNDISLVDITSIRIKVIHKAPENLIAKPGTDTIGLSWGVSKCGNPIGYNIYRRINRYGFIPDSCEYGVPEYTEYELWDMVTGGNINHYTDDNKGSGLVPGFDYCYMVTAYYGDNAESFATPEVCNTLIPGVPALLQVSVEADDEEKGEILVSWAFPHDFDTVDDGPYQYRVYRENPESSNFTEIAVIPTDLSDTAYLDKNINTLIFPYHYSVKVFYQEDNGSWTEYPGSEVASSLYLKLNGSDNTIQIENTKRSPWLNYQFNIFRRNVESQLLDSIGYTLSTIYTDQNLPNNFSFTYKSKALGLRPLPRGIYSTVNKSHLNSAMAIDSVPPCAPLTTVVSYCDSSYNVIAWVSPKTLCGETDIVAYQIYYSPNLDGALQLVGSQNHPDTTFIHSTNLSTLAGVYGVVAVDSFNNVSSIVPVTIDSCLMYWLPNVFSPDNDGINDQFVSYNLGGFVQKVDMKIFNRYGQLVYNTNNPDINWDGYNQISKRIVSSGVYYYVCDVFEPRLTGEVQKTLKGFIHVFSGESNSNAKE